jgi:TRAP-type C4-dicarboxylate transport system permease large subunit
MFLSIANIPATLTESVIIKDMPRMYTLGMVLLLYIPLGMFLGPIEIMLITLPIIFPVLIDLGFSGIWLGILLVKMMEIGYVTPPLGMNVFVLHGMNPKVSLKRIFGHSTRFILADLVVLILCIIFPFLVYYP